MKELILGQDQDRIEEENILLEYLNIQTSEKRKDKNPKTNILKHDTGTNQNICPDCGKEFKFASHVKLHIDMMHKGIQAYVCDQCNHQSKTEKGLKHHVESVHQGIRYPCDQCDQQFT